ncbi:MAG TPA: helix-turn-helix domain-containing protein [Actinomycetota bacterium]|nr:helix-turn-helix domain-containing protein [Actinomycetota bacterium]
MTDAVEAVSLLGEPVRRRLYEFVTSETDAVSREQAAKAVGIKRPLAAFHLDKLAEEGLLEVEFRRLTDRKGPGAGRPAKLYKRPNRELNVSLPHREYQLAARVFAEALSKNTSTDPVREAARALGKEMAEQVREKAGRHQGTKNLTRTAEDVLASYGFEPFHDEEGNIRLRNCPFHQLSRDYTNLVCGMNLDIMQAMVEELGLERLEARLEPQPGMCCVAFRRTRTN